MMSFQGSFQRTMIFHNAIVEANCRWGLLLLEPSLWTAFNPQYSDWTLPVTCGHWYTPTCWPASSNNDHLLHKSHGQNYNLTDKWPGCAHISPMFAFRSSSPSLILEACQGQGQSVFFPLPLPHHLTAGHNFKAPPATHLCCHSR